MDEAASDKAPEAGGIILGTDVRFQSGALHFCPEFNYFTLIHRVEQRAVDFEAYRLPEHLDCEDQPVPR